MSHSGIGSPPEVNDGHLLTAAIASLDSPEADAMRRMGSSPLTRDSFGEPSTHRARLESTDDGASPKGTKPLISRISLRPRTVGQRARLRWTSVFEESLKKQRVEERFQSDWMRKQSQLMRDLHHKFAEEAKAARLKLLGAKGQDAGKPAKEAEREEDMMMLAEGSSTSMSEYRKALLESNVEGAEDIIRLLTTIDGEIRRLGGALKKLVKGHENADGLISAKDNPRSVVHRWVRGLGCPLLPFQVEGVMWMYHHLFQNGLNGVLADDMGLGKTVQTIAFLYVLMMEKNHFGPHMICAPLSTVGNWQSEFERFAPGAFRVISLSDFGDDESIRKFLKQKKGSTWSRPSAGGSSWANGGPTEYNHPYGGDVVIVPHHTFARKLRRTQSQLLNQVQWEYIVVDEAQRIKSKESVLYRRLAKASAKYRLALTGTPLQNDVEEVWSVLSFLMPKHFTDNDTARMGTVFQALKEQQRRRKREEKRAEAEGDETNEDLIEDIDEKEVAMCLQIHRLLRPLFLRRAKAAVLGQLPKKEEHVIHCPLSAMQREWLSDATKCKNAQEARKILLHPYLMMEEFRINEDVARDSGKARVIDAMLKFLISTGHKTLIFCAWTKPLDVIETLLWVRKWPYVRLDGMTKSEDRPGLIAKFHEDPSVQVFLLSKGAGGVGLNLQVADTVILLDVDYNPQRDIQALSRVYRVGQTKDVKVYRLITDTAVEQRMFDIASTKQKMERKVIQAGGYDLHTTDAERDGLLRTLHRQSTIEENVAAARTVGEIEAEESQLREQLLEALPRGAQEQNILNSILPSILTPLVGAGSTLTPSSPTNLTTRKFDPVAGVSPQDDDEDDIFNAVENADLPASDEENAVAGDDGDEVGAPEVNDAGDDEDVVTFDI